VIPFVGRQPVGQAGLEPLAAGLAGGQPDGLERRQQFIRGVVLGPAAHEGRGDRRLGPQGADGRLAVITEEFDQFVEDSRFMWLAGTGVAFTLPGQHFLSCHFTHMDVHALVTPILS